MRICLTITLCSHCVTANLREPVYGESGEISHEMKITKVEYDGGIELGVTFDDQDDWHRWTGNRFSAKEGVAVLHRVDLPFENPYVFPTGAGDYGYGNYSGYKSSVLLAIDLKECLSEPIWARNSSEVDMHLEPLMQVKSVYFSADCGTIFFAENRDHYISRAVARNADGKGYVYLEAPRLSPKLRARARAGMRQRGDDSGIYWFNETFSRALPAKLPKASAVRIQQIDGPILAVILGRMTMEIKKQTNDFDIYHQFYYHLPSQIGDSFLMEHVFTKYHTLQKEKKQFLPVYILAVIADTLTLPFRSFRVK